MYASPIVPNSHVANPDAATTKSDPVKSLWRKLKAENEERKKDRLRYVSAKEAKHITGYGDETGGKKYTNADEACLIDFGYDTRLHWGKSTESSERSKRKKDESPEAA